MFRKIAGTAFRQPAQVVVGPARPRPRRCEPGRATSAATDARTSSSARRCDGGGVRVTHRPREAAGPGPRRSCGPASRMARCRRAGRGSCPGDADRDGREDLFLVTREGNPGRVERLAGGPVGRSCGHGCGPRRSPTRSSSATSAWASRTWTTTGIATCCSSRRTGRGTRIRVLQSRLRLDGEGAEHRSAPSIEWGGLRPY